MAVDAGAEVATRTWATARAGKHSENKQQGENAENRSFPGGYRSFVPFPLIFVVRLSAWLSLPRIPSLARPPRRLSLA